MVLAFQKKYGLPGTGVVDKYTWGKLIDAYDNLLKSIPSEYLQYEDEFFGGRLLTLGTKGDDVRRLQKLLLKICREKRNIPGVRVTGEYDTLTQQSVRVLQELLQLPVNGIVGAAVWNDILAYSKT